MPEKRNILFVDDEVKVLEGLRRMLRSMRQEWEMSFAEGGRQALDMLAGGSFDVIVSDMRMPGMDGAELLGEVMRTYPQIVRIVLSGHSCHEATMRSIGVAHQFLAKPCDADRLKQTIDHAFALRDLMSNETLKQTLSRLTSVPSMPVLYEELLEELQHPDASIQRIGEIIGRDVGMAAKILQLVNSAFFGLPRKVSSAAQAASLLGADTIKALVLGIDVFSQFRDSACGGITPASVQEHSLKVAAAAKEIARVENAGRDVMDASLMAGFLHDIGKLILAQNMPDQYRQVDSLMAEQSISFGEAERAVLGTTHAEVGAYLLGLWGLPDPIVEAAAFHHCPSASCSREFSPLTAVHIANAMLRSCCSMEKECRLDVEYLARLGIGKKSEFWRNAIPNCLETAEVHCE